jgi:hypothetical protein
MTALLNQLVADTDTMTLYIRMGLNTVYASAETRIFGRIMLTEIREQGAKPNTIGYQML